MLAQGRTPEVMYAHSDGRRSNRLHVINGVLAGCLNAELRRYRTDRPSAWLHVWFAVGEMLATLLFSGYPDSAVDVHKHVALREASIMGTCGVSGNYRPVAVLRPSASGAAASQLERPFGQLCRPANLRSC